MHISHLDGSPWASIEHPDIPFFDEVRSPVTSSDISFNTALLDDPLWGSSERRRRTHAMRRKAAKLLFGQSVSRCGGYVSAATRDELGRDWACVYQGKHSAFLGHVISCGSVWHCPYCAARIAKQRRLEVAETMRRHLATGGHVWMGTFTVPHHKFSNCRELRESLSTAFRRLQSGRKWLRWKEEVGLVGAIRGMEVTHGGAGWHPHLHVLFFLDCHPKRAETFGAALFGEWARIVGKLGLGECSEGAWNWRFCNTPDAAGDYVAKWGADWELPHGHLKIAKKTAVGQEPNRSPWQILQDFTTQCWPGDGDLFREYALAFKGARQLTWSRGLKERYLIDELDDAEIVQALEDDESSAVLAVEAPAIRQLSDMGKTCELLEAVERGGYEGGLNFMWALGLHAYVAPPKKVLRGFFCLPKMTNDIRYRSLGDPKRAPHRGNQQRTHDDDQSDFFDLC